MPPRRGLRARHRRHDRGRPRPWRTRPTASSCIAASRSLNRAAKPARHRAAPVLPAPGDACAAGGGAPAPSRPPAARPSARSAGCAPGSAASSRDITRKIAGAAEAERAAFATLLERVARLLRQQPRGSRQRQALRAARPGGRVHRQGQGPHTLRIRREGLAGGDQPHARRAGSSCSAPAPCRAIRIDGHTLAGQIDQVERITGEPVERAYVDRGDRGHDADKQARVRLRQKRGIVAPTIRPDQPAIGNRRSAAFQPPTAARSSGRPRPTGSGAARRPGPGQIQVAGPGALRQARRRSLASTGRRSPATSSLEQAVPVQLRAEPQEHAPSPIAARSISGNSRGTRTPPVALQPLMHLLGDLAAILGSSTAWIGAHPVLEQRLVEEPRPDVQHLHRLAREVAGSPRCVGLGAPCRRRRRAPPRTA